MAGWLGKVTRGDWGFLVISLIFFGLSMFLLTADMRAGVAGLMFVVPCLLLAVERIVARRRRHQFSATLVSAAGGVELRVSARYFALIGMLALSFGGSMFVIPDTPLGVLICGGIFVAGGVAVLVMAVIGVLSRRFLRFDPDGLTMDEGRYAIQVGWDNITRVTEFEYASNDCVGFEIIAPHLVRVTPETRRSSWLKGIANSAAIMGCHVMIMARNYAIDAAPLAMALARYAANARARAELTPRPALPQPEMGSGPNC